MKKIAAAVLLPDIRSAHNIGSIFRTCEAAGIEKIYLAGYSPCPIDAFGRKRKEIVKTALGAVEMLPWEYFKDPVIALKKLRHEGFCVVAIEQAKGAVDYKKININSITRKTGNTKVLFVFGNEVEGISKKLLKLADVVAYIPMKGEKESLNVSVAAGVALFRLLNI